MDQLAMLLRGMQLFAHAAHNSASGKSFFADHEHLGELYETYEGAYDSVVERIIGLGGEIDICDTNIRAAQLSKRAGDCSPSDAAFKVLLDLEKELREECVDAQKGQSIGTINFIQGLADDSEKRTYLLGQRVK